MRTYGFFVLALFVTLLMMACQPAAEPEPVVQAPSPAEMQARTDAYVQAVEAGDAAALAELYTTDAVLMPSDAPAVKGKAEIQAFATPRSEQSTTKLTIDTTETQVGGDWLYAWGTFTSAVTLKAGGETIEAAGKWMNISQRQADGTWKIHRGIWNTDAPMPQPPDS